MSNLGLAIRRIAILLSLALSSPPAFSAENIPGQINYAEHIRPIIEQHCVTCHQPGQIGPMSLRSFAEVRPWTKAIKTAVVGRKMPPFHAAGPLGRYVDDPRLNDEEIALISKWVEIGSPPGSPPVESPSSETAKESGGWLGGTPDLVLKTAPYTVKEGKDDYVVHLIDYRFPEETWIGAIEILQSDYSIVHHSVLHVLKEDKPRFQRRLEKAVKSRTAAISGVGESIGLIGPFLGGWAPGRTSRIPLPNKMAKIPAGSRIALNNHYYSSDEAARPGGQPVVQTTIGLFFFTGEISEVRGVSELIPPPHFEIQPGDPNFEIVYENVLEQDVFIDMFDVHMHLRGKSGDATAVFPDGRRELIFNIPRYDFNWQRAYWLKEPIFAPKGTRIVHRLAWDNSAANPNNPDPSQTVNSGFLSSEEMAVFGVGYSLTKPRDVPIRIVGGRKIEE